MGSQMTTDEATVKGKKGRAVRLTQKAVMDLAPDPARRIRVWDAGVPGLGVVVHPSGKKSYFVDYRTKTDKTQRRQTLGSAASMTLDDARPAARKLMGEVADRKDPMAARRVSEKRVALSDFWKIYRRDFAEVHKKPTSLETDRIMFEKHVEPVLGRHDVRAIERGDVQRLHASMHERPIAANRTFALLSHMMTMAVDWKYRTAIEGNPCKGVRRYDEADRQRDRYLSPDELSRLWAALGTLEREPRFVRQPAIEAIRLLIFTGCRRGEILNLRWEHVDLDGACLNLPDSKSGRKKVVLNRQALKVLNDIKRKREGWVFPGEVEGQPVQEIKKAWAAACKLAEIEGLRVHDLRHSFATIGVGVKASLPMLGKLLGHKPGSKMTARYSHVDDSPWRVVSEAIGDEMDSIISGAKVVTMNPEP